MRALLTAMVAVAVVSSCALPPSSLPNSTLAPSTAGHRTSDAKSGAPTSATSSVGRGNRLVLNKPSRLGPAWRFAFKVGYGTQPAQLGTYLGGDGMGVRTGPDYGTQAPDGTWWFLDPAKVRLAHYSAGGAYLGQSLPPKGFLGGGRFLEYQRLTALADGTLVAHSTSVNEAGLLVRSPDGGFKQLALRDFFAAQTTDGTYEYGFMGTRCVRVDPATGRATGVDRLIGPGGHSFAVALTKDGILVTTRGGTAELPVEAEEFPGLPVHLNIEANTSSDGTLNVLLTGIVEPPGKDAATVIGFVTFDELARVITTDDVRDPTSSADPASGLHLGVRLGDWAPWLMFVDADGVRVYRRG